MACRETNERGVDGAVDLDAWGIPDDRSARTPCDPRKNGQEPPSGVDAPAAPSSGDVAPTPPEPPLVAAVRSRLGAKFQVARPRPAPAGAGRIVDHGAWTAFLAHVTDGWTVDYRTVRRDRARLGGYLDTLAHANPDALGRDEQLAFWINAYNANILALVADHRPPVSVLDVPEAFTGQQLRVGGRGLTADQIEHGIVRRLGDHTVHFGLNCASVGCPPLRAYDGMDIAAQLAANGRRYLADTRRGARAADGRLMLSMVFRWFAGDFAPIPRMPSSLSTAVGLLRPARVLPAARRYLPSPLVGLEKPGFIVWDWTLNDRDSGRPR